LNNEKQLIGNGNNGSLLFSASDDHIRIYIHNRMYILKEKNA
jgi:hypothetical protein